jgi:hypothetical protein
MLIQNPPNEDSEVAPNVFPIDISLGSFQSLFTVTEYALLTTFQPEVEPSPRKRKQRLR